MSWGILMIREYSILYTLKSVIIPGEKLTMNFFMSGLPAFLNSFAE